MLLQIFTKPVGDRPTVFFEIIERLCTLPPPAEVNGLLFFQLFILHVLMIL